MRSLRLLLSLRGDTPTNGRDSEPVSAAATLVVAGSECRSVAGFRCPPRITHPYFACGSVRTLALSSSSNSIGNGKMIVEFFSAAISVSVCR